jgi:hypothetical protein
VRTALRDALGDLYRNSWRFVLANSCLSAAVLLPLVLAVTTTVLAPVLLVLLAGPVCAGLVHCVVAVTQGETGEVRVADFARGVRRHWRRGLLLGTVLALVTVAGLTAVRFYAARGGIWTVGAFACGYALAATALFQLVLWPVAVHQADRPLAAAATAAAQVFLRRWPAVLALGAILAVVNLLGIAAVLPFLTFTVAFSFLAAAHLVLPPRPALEA